MLEIALVRHGRTDWNDLQKVMGRKPIPLNALGREQAAAAAAFLAGAKLAAIVASPVRRAVETAEAIAAQQGGMRIEEDAGFTEIDYGLWEDLRFSELEAQYGELWRRYRADPAEVAFPGGDRIADAAARIGASLDRIRTTHRDGRVAVVTHADVVKLALVHLLGLPLAKMARFVVENCSVTIVRCAPDAGPRLACINHLAGLGEPK